MGKRVFFYDIQRTSDDNLIIVGESYPNLWLLKINKFGDILINETIEGPYDSVIGFDVKQTFDEGYIIAGCMGPPPCGEELAFLVKTDSLGNKIWEKTLDGVYNCVLNNIVYPTVDGGYITVGMTESMPYSTNVDFFVTKFSSEDFGLPNIQILKPENGLYIQNKKILEVQSTLILGSINISCDVTDEGTGVASVEIYIDDELKTIRENPPYSWMWNEQVFGQYNIKIVAYDHAGNKDTIQKGVLKFF